MDPIRRLAIGDRALRVAAMATSFVCSIFAAGYVIAFIWIASRRAAYPFDLEWMEGGMVDHVRRVLSGGKLYVAPSVDFVTFIYNPLYYYLAAPFAFVFGVGHFALRLVSILGTLSCFGLIFAIVYREAKLAVPALVATGMFAGSYALSGGWFDLARVDTTSLAFLLGAWYVARFARTRRGTAISGMLVAAAFLTKQTAILVAPALFLSTGLLHGFRRCVWFAPAAVLTAALLALLETTSHGWYSFYTFRVPSGFTNEPDMVVDFWKKEIFSEFSMALVLGLYFAFSARDRFDWTAALKVHVPFVVSTLGMAYVVRMHSGSFLNDKMPAHAALSIVAGLGLARLSQTEPLAARDRMWIFGGVVALGQMLFLLYPPNPWLPRAADAREGNLLMDVMARYEGEVLVTHHGGLTLRQGRPSFAQAMAVFDVVRTDHDWNGAKRKLTESYRSAYASHRFSAVFTDNGLIFNDLLARYYKRGPSDFIQDQRAFLPKTGPTYRPLELYVPK